MPRFIGLLLVIAFSFRRESPALQKRLDCAAVTVLEPVDGTSLLGSRGASDVLRARRRSSQASNRRISYFTDLPNFRNSGPPPAQRILARVEVDRSR
jgi:hypothetical protein